ncbi:MAG TPA: hypothetical protein VG841_07980 [Caulobacterales bacterium]|nr:hypothetical protein [Caulobacterales bacterium]
MRTILGAACAFVMIATPTLSAADAPGWHYAYENGVAQATARDERGKTIATMSCRPPTGDIILQDYTLGRYGRNARTATVAIGTMSVNIPATVERVGRDRVLSIRLPQRPPILAGVQEQDRVTVSVNGHSATYSAGSGVQMKDVAFACWGG